MPDSTEVKIFIFAGQSNMFGKMLGDTPVDAATVKEKIYYSYLDQEVRSENGQDPDNLANFGPEYGFIKSLQANGVDDFYVLKTAWSGTSLTPDRVGPLPDWHPDSDGELFDVMIADYQALIAQVIADGGTPVLEGFYWSQGGGDRKFLSTYEENLEDYFSQLQIELGQTVDVFFLEETHTTDPFLIDDLNAIRDIQHSFASTHEYVTMISTAGYSFIDGLHFDAASQYDIGRNLAERYLATGDDPVLEPEQAENVFFDHDDRNRFFGTDADEIVFGYRGNDRLDGADGNDSLIGDGGDDILYGRAGDDYLDGGVGFNVLYGGTGEDVLNAKHGSVRGFGGGDNDILIGWLLDDVFRGGLGHDLLLGDRGDDRLFGGLGNDELLGDDGNDILFGDGGKDSIRAGAGDDQITGGQGDDTIILGEGHNQVRFDIEDMLNGSDVIYFFDVEQDSLLIKRDASLGYSRVDLPELVTMQINQGKAKLYLDTDDGAVLFLTLVDVDDSLTVADMVEDGSLIFL
ncbi:sialate O-acetylesterase [Phaeobacter marinintestinus]|uniref:sialate O-acetylesterase n=1 Tax=Falsiphaeobacter marinintestinus TaxID=1492905 RepID=UPI0011B70109|nr:sialate O-acetylesterase [Phaeobacter marinintestinus]